MATYSPELENHKAWLGYLQPEGLVVTAQTLVDAGVQIDRAQLGSLQERFTALTTTLTFGDDQEAVGIGNLPLFFEEFLGWLPTHLVGDLRPDPIPESLIVALPDFEETLSPTSALRKFQPKPDANPWSLLVQKIPTGQDFDQPHAYHARGWEASPTRKFERLLRDTQVHVGLLTNGLQFRLVYAPAKENAGHVTFPVQAMTEVGGRLILGACHLLLGAQSVLNAPDKRHLHRLLAQSREYQATVSEQLAEQVLTALHELLRGFQAANDLSQGKVLRHPLTHDPNQIYEGLLTILLRMVFLLFAEDRALMPGGQVYSNHYGLHALFEKLRKDAEKHADHMDDRFGAWARLLAVFRIVHQGCKHGALRMPPRHGHLFDPERFPFLEGRIPREGTTPENIPMVSDGVILRVLTNLLILDGERISYRSLDVEEIGSVYQTIMGFGVLVSPGTTIALKGKRKNGSVPAAPVVVIEDLLAQPAKDRAKWLKEKADHALTGEAEKSLKSATTIDDCLAALSNRIDRTATPGPVQQGRLVLEPTDERRRSGSHYTPRSFTEPIVRKTLEPILKRFGEHPTPTQILELKICDIAVGSAAFLVESCRQLADVLVGAWRKHGSRPQLPPDETEELLAMRLVAQHCLYGVDRNSMAVDLAKLSLWLATLAKDHPFTFLDHAIRCGDSLVGLTRRQIETFTWKTESTQGQLWEQEVRKRTAAALRERQNLLGLGDDFGTPQLKREKLDKADELLDLVRFIGDAAIAAFFSADKDKAREAKRAELAERIAAYLSTGDLKLRPTAEVKALRGESHGASGEDATSDRSPLTAQRSPPNRPFHWEIEFPEVFDRENPGFDGFIGNPPFIGGTMISTSNGEAYKDWLYESFPESGNRMDVVAYFFRHAFSLLREAGTLGLIATNTIAQGDTRKGGLRYICKNNGVIFDAQKRIKWPGIAAVTVSSIHIIRGSWRGIRNLDNKPVNQITAFLFANGSSDDPQPLYSNAGRSFEGFKIAGQGFLFADDDEEASSLSEMERLCANPQNRERILPYIGGEEVNDSPTHTFHRYVIDFDNLEEAEAARWPELLEIVRTKVKPYRDTVNREAHRKRWWIYGERRPGLRAALQGKDSVLVCSLHQQYWLLSFLPGKLIFSHGIGVFVLEHSSALAVLQSRTHELWARFFGSSLEDRLRYTPSDCFETFPFPVGFETDAALEAVGQEYYEFRAALMQDLWLGLTEIYNLFHAPDEEGLARLETLYRKRAANNEWRTVEKVPEDRSPLTIYRSPTAALAGVRRLRELHAAMDAAVLTAYGWEDLIPKCTCEFLLDYEDEEVDEEEGKTRKRKKPWRYRWPDDVRDEVLARLLKLNAERAEEERLLGATAIPPGEKKGKRARKSSAAAPSQTERLQDPQKDLFA
jgi:hypothetical protein